DRGDTDPEHRRAGREPRQPGRGHPAGRRAARPERPRRRALRGLDVRAREVRLDVHGQRGRHTPRHQRLQAVGDEVRALDHHRARRGGVRRRRGGEARHRDRRQGRRPPRNPLEDLDSRLRGGERRADRQRPDKGRAAGDLRRGDL
ncbi:MAG: PTS system, mannitol-specific IIA component, partial [uncultured Rubrobacteraceae bacterium]